MTIRQLKEIIDRIPEEKLDSEVLVDIGFANEGGEYNTHYVDFCQDEDQLIIGV